MKRYLLSYRVLILLTAIPLIAAAQASQVPAADSSSNRGHASLTIQTDIDSAVVIVDGVRVGVTPFTVDSLNAGEHIVKLLQPDRFNWLLADITDTVQVPPSGQPRTLRYAFERQAFIISQPFGAEVYLGDSLCGTTPLLLSQRAVSSRSIISLRKEGYDTVAVDPGIAHRGVVSLVLTPQWQRDVSNGLFLDESAANGSKKLRLYIAGASTVLSGIAAAYLKVKADDRFLEYTSGGDPTLLSQTHRLDTAAGIALGITQVCFGIFSYFLLSE